VFTQLIIAVFGFLALETTSAEFDAKSNLLYGKGTITIVETKTIKRLYDNQCLKTEFFF
jgi:hypothetical protein